MSFRSHMVVLIQLIMCKPYALVVTVKRTTSILTIDNIMP